jgi:hypothetical protein
VAEPALPVLAALAAAAALVLGFLKTYLGGASSATGSTRGCRVAQWGWP